MKRRSLRRMKRRPGFMGSGKTIRELIIESRIRMIAEGREVEVAEADAKIDAAIKQGEATIRAAVDARPSAPAVMGTILTGLSMMLRTTLGPRAVEHIAATTSKECADAVRDLDLVNTLRRMAAEVKAVALSRR